MVVFLIYGLFENGVWMLIGCIFFCNILFGVEYFLMYVVVVYKCIIYIVCSIDLCYFLLLLNMDVFCLI